jgi:NADP-dependent alcohol dehydrogenase
MNPFEIYNPTKIIFGPESYLRISHEIPKDAKILLTYGGGSIKENGVYDQVMKQLEGYDVIEFGGIEPNPSYETLSKAVEVIKKDPPRRRNYILAVGGGSVIDGSKFLAAAALYEGENTWDILKKGIRTFKALPIATVLTLPATGTESNSGAVVSNKTTGEKLGMGGPGLFPVVSFLNPEVVKSIPKRQLQNGIIDSFSHVLEQYMTYPIGADLQDRFAESILITLIETAPKLIFEPYNYTTAANYMWSSTMALNGLIGKGVPVDWATHQIGHEITALYNIDHAMTLAIIFPNLFRLKFENKKDKLAQYGERIFGIKSGTIDERANQAIDKTIEFLHSIDVKTKLSDYTSNYHHTADHVQKTFESRGWVKLGERQDLTPSEAFQIVEMSY